MQYANILYVCRLEQKLSKLPYLLEVSQTTYRPEGGWEVDYMAGYNLGVVPAVINGRPL